MVSKCVLVSVEHKGLIADQSDHLVLMSWLSDTYLFNLNSSDNDELDELKLF